MASSVYPIKRYEFSLPKEFAGSVEVILTEMAPEIFYFVCYLTIREENTASWKIKLYLPKRTLQVHLAFIANL